MDAGLAALIGAGIGAAAGIGASVVTGFLQRGAMREARREERRATAYLDIAEHLQRLGRIAKMFAYPKERPGSWAQTDPPWDEQLTAIAHVDIFASATVQILYEQYAVTLSHLAAAAMSTPPGAPEDQLEPRRALYAEVLDQASDLVAQMKAELQPRSRSRSGSKPAPPRP